MGGISICKFLIESGKLSVSDNVNLNYKKIQNKDVMTIEDVKKIIDGDETRTLEMKKTTGELKDGIRSVCAFLNEPQGQVP